MGPSLGMRSSGATTAVAVISLSATVVTIWLTIAAFRLYKVNRRLRRVEVVEPPSQLVRLAESAGIARLTCLKEPSLAAFVAGALNPTVYVTARLASSLGSDELLAVLVHERDHAVRREPLRRALREALVSILPFLPVVTWWAERQAEVAELRADATALARVDARSVARAMWALDLSPRTARSIAFGGTTTLRVAQVLGDPISLSRPHLSLFLTSAVGLGAVLAIGICLVGALSRFGLFPL